MNKKRLKILSGLVLFVFLVSGCQHVEKEIFPPIPGIDPSSDHVNQDINLVLRPSLNTFKIDDDVVIDVHLKSDIQVNSDFDVNMYVLDKQTNSWTEVADFVNASPVVLLPLKNEEVILEKNNPNLTIIVHPILKDKSTEIKLLITIKGSVLENNEKTSKNVESYIILTLYP